MTPDEALEEIRVLMYRVRRMKSLSDSWRDGADGGETVTELLTHTWSTLRRTESAINNWVHE